MNVAIIIRILSAAVEIPHEVLIVHDTKDDDSIPIVRSLKKKYPNVRLVHNRLGLGVTNAVKAGVTAARGTYILIFAADEVGPVMAIDDMLALMDSGCDLVSCTRYARGGRRLGGSLVGGILSRTANWAMRRLFGMTLTDATTGIKMFKKEDFEKFTLQAKHGWACAFELAIKAQTLGFTFGEVPIVSIDRVFGGTSSFTLGPWVKEYLYWMIWGMQRLPGTYHKKVLTIEDVPNKPTHE